MISELLLLIHKLSSYLSVHLGNPVPKLGVFALGVAADFILIVCG